MQVIFSSELEAKIVGTQLYNVQQIGEALEVKDIRALELAASLSNINYILEGTKCPLPFPRDERECSDENTPKIYVACLAAYNSGHLHGLWIDATQDPEAVNQKVFPKERFLRSANAIATDEAGINNKIR
jgi:antirestriction protein